MSLTPEKDEIAAADTAAAGPDREVDGLLRWLAPPLPWAVVTFWCVAAAGWQNRLLLVADSTYYRALALGHYRDVPGSVAGRILHPLTVRLLSAVLGADIDTAFLLAAIVSLAALCGLMAWILKQVTGFGALVLPLLFTPLVVHYMFGLYYCQDLFYAALLGCFFAAMLKERKWLALLLLLPLYLARESTVLLAVAWGAVAWLDSDWTVLAACGIFTVGGLGVSRIFASLGRPNIHHTNEFTFLFLKPPFDALRTLFGVILIPPEMKGHPGFTCTPFATFALPKLLRYGTTTQFGVCRPDWHAPVHTYTLLFAIFGIGPAALLAVLRRNLWRGFQSCSPSWLRVAVIYGLMALCVAPAVSFWLERDFGYAWPAFWIALPALLRADAWPTAPLVCTLLAENLAACWLPYWLSTAGGGPFELAALGIAFIMQVVAYSTLKRHQARWIPAAGRRAAEVIG